VKTAKHHIKKTLLVILSLAYLFSVSAYVVFHPKCPDASAASAAAATPHLQQNSSPANNYNLLHGAFKSVIENKIRAKSFSRVTTTFIFILAFSLFDLLIRDKKSRLFLSSVPYTRPHNYISLRTFRI
jgi:hypothetical protein